MFLASDTGVLCANQPPIPSSSWIRPPDPHDSILSIEAGWPAPPASSFPPQKNRTKVAMPSLRLSFPEKESPSVVVLRGQRITIGRLPQNNIQIRDRTISGLHAELIEEDDHYRLHDIGATNGVLVNGEPVTDFHLREACKITFGGVECEFSPEASVEAEADPSVALMTRGESEVLLTKNSELEKTIASLRDQLTDLQKPVGETEEIGELERLTRELSTVRDSLATRDREIEKVKADLAVLQRDRANLQRALNEAKAKPAPITTTPKQAEAPERPAAVPVPAPAPAPLANFPAAKPVVPPSKPSLPKPNTPLPHATAVAAATTPAPVPAGARPVAKPQPAGASNGNGVPRPAPYAKSPVGGANSQATPKPSLATRPPTAVSGPKGTQKIDT
jgi:pSer/pThr/pTyr-binding forkhead associated (FHA) protein